MTHTLIPIPPPLLTPDADLVHLARQGDRTAFSSLVTRYEPPALLIALSILRSPHDARDAVQDSFVAAYLKLNRLWSPHKFGPWFLRITRRHSILHLRRHRSHPFASLNHDPPYSPPEIPDTLSLIPRLPEHECVIVSLRHLENLSVADISRITGRPIGTVTKQLSRAYARMRPWLEQ